MYLILNALLVHGIQYKGIHNYSSNVRKISFFQLKKQQSEAAPSSSTSSSSSSSKPSSNASATETSRTSSSSEKSTSSSKKVWVYYSLAKNVVGTDCDTKNSLKQSSASILLFIYNIFIFLSSRDGYDFIKK